MTPHLNVVHILDIPPLSEHAQLDSLADAIVEVSENFYDRIGEVVSLTQPHVVELGDDSDPIAIIIVNQESIYQRRNASTGPSASVTQYAIDNPDMNVGTRMPLSEMVVGESSVAVEQRAATSTNDRSRLKLVLSVLKILNASSVCLAQLTPLAVRILIA